MTKTANSELLKRLDRQNSILKGFLFISAALTAFLIWYGSPLKPIKSSIAAKEFLLLDEKGNIRASLKNGPEGPEFIMSDEKGNPRMQLIAGSIASEILVFDPGNKPKIGFVVQEDLAKFTFADDRGNGVAGFVVDKTDARLLFGKKEEARLGLGTSKEGPAIEFIDSRKALRAKMWYDMKKPRFLLLDEKEKLLWTAP